ncbi:pilus assembly protein TadG-related protein [Pengzhenrongella frigida]|uniref:Putative Flp pilus-assembly TadG-like N-terminal domain-containing protein n=1 Tax=Pengzhenrongella frigida TaxID=1259133 RepID=A0A4Q5N239_9MICO|nr:pilus assembly protein TadG-related protein [Cellulomonas sp. HLT2-17]RYV52228.1 hypothetical protein EUA98_04465 [Cellulomonas sp. HLT2-17]
MSQSRRPGRAGRERGQSSVLLIGSVMVVVVIAIAFLVPFGSYFVDKRESSTAADAAALAAVGAWRDDLRAAYDGLDSAPSDAAFYGHVGDGLGTYLSYLPARQVAADFAARNDAELVDFSVDGARGAVSVRVRSVDLVPGTSERAESTATARLRFAGGLCVNHGVLGVVLAGSCKTSAPPAPPAPAPTPTPTPTAPDPAAPTPTPTPTPEPPPYEIPGGVEGFAVTAVLTSS